MTATISSVNEPTAVAAALPATDRDLLGRFAAGDEAAFARVVERHGGLVSRVCRSLLREAADVEDAFQATFFVLARKAASLQWHDSVAGWLHQTARRTALKLRGNQLKRQKHENTAAKERECETGARSPSPATQSAVQELSALLDEEIGRLPTRFAEVILLSQVEGLGREEIAQRLGITTSAAKDRLERGREQLRARLVKRGVTLTAAALAAWLAPAAAHAAPLASLSAATAPAAVAFASGVAAGAAGGLVSGGAASLAQGVLQMMGLEKMKTAFLFLFSLLAAGGIALGVLQDEPERFEKGLRGEVVAVDAAGQRPSLTVKLDEFEALLSLDIDPSAKVWSAYESVSLTQVKKGQYVSLRLAEDHRTVREVHIRGERREFLIQEFDADTGRMSVTLADDDEDDDEEAAPAARPARQVTLAKDAILRIGGLPARRGELAAGMKVPLEFGPDGRTVNAIEADAEDGTIIDGDIAALDAAASQITVRYEDDNDQAIERALTVPADAFIHIDGKPAKLADLKRGSGVTLRTSADGNTLKALRAQSPDDDEEEEAPAPPLTEPRPRSDKSEDR